MPITIKTKVEVTDERISDLLCSAIEGGSNYWYTISAQQRPHQCYIPGADPEFFHLYYPLTPTGSITIADREEYDDDPIRCEKHKLNLSKLYQGVHIMADKYPGHFRNFIDEADDAETGDVFLQCCLFGEIVYG